MKLLLLGSKEYPFHSGAGHEKKPSGGMEKHVDKLAKYLIREGHKITIITRKFPGQKEEEEINGLKIYRVPFLNHHLVRGPSFNIFAYNLVKELAVKEKLDMAHAHGPMAGYFASKLRKKGLLKYVYTPHGTPKEYNKVFNAILSKMNKKAAERAEKIIYISEVSKKEMEGKIKGIKKKGVLLANGIDFEDYKRASPEKKKDKLNFCFTGRLEKIKGVDILLHAFSRLERKNKAVHLDIAGEGTEKDKLEALSQELNLKNCVFHSWVEDIPVFLKKQDVFVLPSRETGQPISLLEAKAAGLIVITSLPFVKEGRSGLVIEPKIDSLAQAMEKVAGKPEKYKKLGVSAREEIKELSWAELVKKYVSVYKKAG